jgi:2,4-dienoyl-CoA reductase-like NADH-dependent reductase (Old Yellow Enzyme family)
MEGWDGTTDGEPSDLAGGAGDGSASGAKRSGAAKRRRPSQWRASESAADLQAHRASTRRLRDELVAAHRDRFGSNADSDLYLGLQLTHSVRFSRPNVWNVPEPLAVYAHPVLDKRFPAGVAVMSDDDIDRLVDDFVDRARRASAIGFQFVDIKHCHGYFGHELLSARGRPGKYGGSLANRTRFLFNVVDGIRATVPGLGIGVRLSVLDSVPYRKSAEGPGVPEVEAAGYTNGFGVLECNCVDRALNDSRDVLRLLQARDVSWVCVTAGSPYYCPHVVRPALFPPIDGYEPPEDPFRGVARQIDATARLKAEFPDIVFVGSAYSYLQEWLPHVAQYNLRHGMTDFIGLGRIALSSPESRLTCWPAARWPASCYAGPSATARRAPGLASSPAVTRSIPTTRTILMPPRSKTRRRRRNMIDRPDERKQQLFAVVTAFLALFAVVGFALYGLPRFYPYFVKELGWSGRKSPPATPTARSGRRSRSVSWRASSWMP